MKRGNWPGTWAIICDVCGFRFPSDQVRTRWDGLVVCKNDFEHDHPQKFIRVREQSTAPNPIRTEPADTFVFVCTLITNQGLADIGVADCAQADRDNNLPFQSI